MHVQTNIKIHIVHKSSNNVWHLITKTITTLQHSATLHHTSPNCTSLHFTTLHPTTLHYISPHFTQLHFTTLNDTSVPLLYTSLPSQLALRIYISYRIRQLFVGKIHSVEYCTNEWNINIFKPLWSLYVPPGQTFANSTFCPMSVFMCLVWISERTVIISLYSINWLLIFGWPCIIV